MALYDFMSDLSQLNKQYESYEEKQKNQYENLKKSITEQAAVDGYALKPEAKTQNNVIPQSSGSSDSGFGLSDIAGLFKSNKNKTMKSQGTANSDGTVSIDPGDLGDEGSGYSDSTEEMSGMGSGSKGGFVSNYGSAIGAGAGMLSNAFTKDDTFNNKNYSDKYVQKDEQRDKTIGTTKDVVATALGPWGMLFRGVEKLGNAAGDAVGGEAGAVVSSIFSPDETVMSMNSDPDVKTGDKIIGTILPMYGAVANFKAKEKRRIAALKSERDLDINKTRREQEQRMKDGQESLERLTELRKAQLGYL